MRHTNKIWQYCYRLLLLGAAMLPAESSHALLITEISLAEGQGRHSWIEIYNDTATTVNLKGWGLSDLSGSDTAFATEATYLPPREYALIHYVKPGEASTTPFLASENAATGNGKNGILDLVCSDPAPNFDNEFCFLALTSSPGTYRQSLDGTADIVCLNRGSGRVSPYRLTIMQAVLDNDLWQDPDGIFSPSAGIETLTNYPSPAELPLVDARESLVFVRNRSTADWQDTDSHRDWLPRKAYTGSPGTEQRETALRLEMQRNTISSEQAMLLHCYYPSGSHLQITVHDLEGRHLLTLADRKAPEQFFASTWRGRDRAGEPLAAGVYLVNCLIIHDWLGLFERRTFAVILGNAAP